MTENVISKGGLTPSFPIFKIARFDNLSIIGNPPISHTQSLIPWKQLWHKQMNEPQSKFQNQWLLIQVFETLLQPTVYKKDKHAYIVRNKRLENASAEVY